MPPKVYIDGHVGTTGLRIRDWLAGRRDIEVSTLDEDRRKDVAARRAAIEAADLTVLCLPDDAAREATQWAAECGTRVIDASTAHRVADGWTYGLPELDVGRRDAIRDAQFVANPGCYPSALILLTRPLVDAGLLPHDTPVSIHALSGYSGGGRGLIEKWESPDQGLGSLPYEAPYALGARHKHIPEMVAYSGLTTEPQFVPAVGPFRCGMRVEVPIPLGMLPMGGNSSAILECLLERYDGEPFIRVVPHPDPRDAHETQLRSAGVQRHQLHGTARGAASLRPHVAGGPPRQPRQGRQRRGYPEPQPHARPSRDRAPAEMSRGRLGKENQLHQQRQNCRLETENRETQYGHSLVELGNVLLGAPFQLGNVFPGSPF